MHLVATAAWDCALGHGSVFGDSVMGHVDRLLGSSSHSSTRTGALLDQDDLVERHEDR